MLGLRAATRMQLLRRSTLALHTAPKTQKAGVFCRVTGLQTRAVAADSNTSSNWEIRMLYDGDCPLCMKEVNFLKQRDEGKDKIQFVDISTDDYSPEDNYGITFEQAMEKIHAVLPDGRIIVGVEVFRRLYEAVGLGWVYAITSVEPVGKAAEAVYNYWAKYRTQITGREALAVILSRRSKQGQLCGSETVECVVKD